MGSSGKVKIGINGFGRIGRLVARVALQRDDVELVAINDPFISTHYMTYMFKYDSVHGQWKHNEVTVKDSKTLLFGEKEVTVFGIRNPEEIPWAETGAHFIIEPTGVFTDKEEAAGHLKGGANKVIIPGPTKDDPILVVGVNGKEYKPDLDGLPPLAKDIRDRLGVVEDLIGTVHSFVATQKTVDGWGIGRATSSTNILPVTGATKAVGNVLPALNGKFTAATFCDPTVDFSTVDLMDIGINREESQSKLKCIHVVGIKEEQQDKLKSICVEKPPHTRDLEMGIKEEEQGMVASDSAAGNRSSIFGARALTKFRESTLELIDRHRDEMGYWARVLEVIARAADLTSRAAHLASLAWFTCTRVRGLIAEIAEIFN